MYTCHLAPGEADAGDYQFKASQDNTERSSLKLSVLKEELGLRHSRYCASGHVQDPGFNPQQGRNWVCRHKPVIPTTQEVEDQEFKFSLGYRKPCFKIRKHTKKEIEGPQSQLRESIRCADRRCGVCGKVL